MPDGDFDARQIFIAHEGLWQAMVEWAEQHNFHLHRIPDGATDEGRPFFHGDLADADFTPTYAFMPK